MILLQPIIKAGINRFIKGSSRRQSMFRDGTVIVLALLIMTASYFGTNWILGQLESLFAIAYLSPTMPLYLVFLILFALLVISNIVSMSGGFFQSEDINLLLASPLKNSSLFFQRFFTVMVATSAVSIIFILPILIAYYVRYGSGYVFSLIWAFSLIPFFIIPACIGFFGATLLAWLQKIRQSKIFFLSFILLFIFTIWRGIEVIRLVVASKENVQEFSQLVGIFQLANLYFTPSTWMVEAIDISLGFNPNNVSIRLGILWGLSLLLLGICYSIFQASYLSAYSASQAQGSRKQYRNLRFAWLLNVIPSFLRKSLAIVKRDVLLLTRDIAQIFQAVLLMGVFAVYIYNLRLFSGLSVAGPTEMWWRNFLFITNFCMSAFVALAVCTRFVFPSISVDGRAYVTYIIKSPISIKQFIVTKFIFWGIIVAMLHGFVSGFGTYASGAGMNLILMNVVNSIVITIGLVGLGTGFGAIYGRFDWEHLSQLAVGYGNIIFMLVASGWIFLSLLPSWIMIVSIDQQRIGMIFYLAFLFLVFSNSLLAAFLLRKGINYLEDKQH